MVRWSGPGTRHVKNNLRKYRPQIFSLKLPKPQLKSSSPLQVQNMKHLKSLALEYQLRQEGNSGNLEMEKWKTQLHQISAKRSSGQSSAHFKKKEDKKKWDRNYVTYSI